MAEDSSMKMEALKKAYAEIILNTSKEAAARIMVADRRAMCFQKDLFALKEDALRLLVQLKQMADSKIAAAEIKSENQQRKIEELEAQLSEAEGIIMDLREELRLTQDKLEEVKYSQWRPSKKQTPEDFEDQPPPLYKKLIAKADDERYGAAQYPSTENAIGSRNSDEMALHNACEDQLHMSAGELPTAPLQPSMISRAVQYPSTEDACSTKIPIEMALQYPSGDQLLVSDVEKSSTSFQPFMLSQASVNAVGDGKANRVHCTSSSSDHDAQDEKLVSNGSQAKSQEHESHQGQSFRDGSRRNRKNLKYQEAIAALRRSSHGRNAKSCQLPSLSKCRTKVVKQNKSSIEVLDKNEMYPMPGSCYKMDHEHDHDTAQEKSTEFGDKSLSVEMGDCNLHDMHISEDEESGGVCNRADSDKALKFTFQRKRKRELLTDLDGNPAPEGNNVLVEANGKGNNVMSSALLQKGNAVKLQKSIVKDEQTNDGRQLLQIAQQLISLSGNGHS